MVKSEGEMKADTEMQCDKCVHKYVCTYAYDEVVEENCENFEEK